MGAPATQFITDITSRGELRGVTMFLQLFVLVLVTHQLQSSPRLNAKHPGAKISLEELEAENTRGECVLPLPSYICPQFKDEVDETSDEEPQADPESAEKTFWPFAEGSGEEGSGSETSGEDPASVSDVALVEMIDKMMMN